MKRFLLASAVVAVLGFTALVLLRANTDALIRSRIDRTVTDMAAAQIVPDTRFEVVFCGTGSPQYNPDRAQPCTGVIAGGRFFLFDAGQGAAQQLNATRAPYLKLDTVFLTHLHSDHMSGLADVLHNGWLLGRQHVVDVVGPPGTEKLLSGVALSLEDDLAERERVLGTEYINSKTALGAAREVSVEGDAITTVYDQDGVVIRAFAVDHPDWPHAYGYRIEFDGASIVISGDTAATPAMVRHARGADVLIHEVVNVRMMELAAEALSKHGGAVQPERMALITAVHTPTHDAARIAADAEVGRLVLTHLIPPIPANRMIESIFTDGMDDLYDGKLVVARDGMRLTLRE